MIAAQADRATRLRAAHDVIDNSGAVELTRRQVALLHHRYLELAIARRVPRRPDVVERLPSRRLLQRLLGRAE